MKHDIGQLKRDQAAETRARILAYMQKNPLARQHECARDLGLSGMTVSRHFTALRAEWMESRKAETNG